MAQEQGADRELLTAALKTEHCWMMSPPPLRFVTNTVTPVILICEGSLRPRVGQRVRATGSEGNGFLVVGIIDHEYLIAAMALSTDSFGLKLKNSEVPWPPNTPIEIL